MAVDSEFTIDELARESGMTVRTLRVYNERGLLPPPQLKGRTGFYSEEHLNRVRIISRLLDRGIKLNGVRDLLEAWDRGDDLAAVLGVSASASASVAPAPSRPAAAAVETTIAATELAERFAEIPNGLARVVSAGLYEPVDATTYRVKDPQLVAIAAQLQDAGVPQTRVLDELERLRDDCDHIARQFVDMFERTAVRDFRRSERGSQDVADLVAHLSMTRSMPGRVAADLIGQYVARYLEHVTRELGDALPGNV
ncbi:MerR family transcriptional regulator [Nocardia sp. NEAU-G5]|uniref:MerR family transcriptional regulator n=1 Tax=Nocardia albiluteola TaxID=2842303 RepID=A0ABS6BBA6_9NOCA|nr:MerR family transcriptional regulator [Nocardia albiluteola]MBU3067433.1 MerR family transcriptional regulator [Nocardia albiluteola]